VVAVTTVFLTGFPGFLGSALVGRLLDRYPDDVTVTCLVQSKYAELADRRAERIEADHDAAGRIRLVAGDVTEPDLGLGDAASLREETVEVYHLAAVYDLGAERAVAKAVNLDGTRHVLDYAEACPNLRRVQYVSTCYVSGRHDGEFTADHLAEGQQFNNHYETTKFLAELDVQRRMDEGLPATVYRPGIVVGDSRTGQTQKYDGPYYVLRSLLRQPDLAVLPTVGDPERVDANLVPRDFVVDAIAHLSALDRSEGEVYQLANPDPPTVAELLSLFERATGKRALRVPLPKAAFKSFLRRPLGQRIVPIEPNAVDYFDLPTRHTCETTMRDLEGSGIECPRVEEYVDAMVAYVREHPEANRGAMT
jgi:thioester reductase-like protein